MSLILACFYKWLPILLCFSNHDFPAFAGYRTGASTSELPEELLLIFPVLGLVSSPSRSIKQTATYLLSVLGKTASDILIAPRKEKLAEGQNLTSSTPGHIIFKFIRNILFKVCIIIYHAKDRFLCVAINMPRLKHDRLLIWSGYWQGLSEDLLILSFSASLPSLFLDWHNLNSMQEVYLTSCFFCCMSFMQKYNLNHVG